MNIKLKNAGPWVAIALALALTGTARLPGGGPVLAASLGVPVPVTDDVCDLWCLDEAEADCGTNRHFAYEPLGAPGYWRAGGPHNSDPCRLHLCQNRHGACIPDPGNLQTFEVEELRLALAGRDVLAARGIIQKHRSQVSANVARSAVQVFSPCTGEVVAHFPVSRATIDALADDEPK